MSLGYRKRNAFTRMSSYEEGDEYIPPFCEEIRDFKTKSRDFHEWIANTEAVHNPRYLSLDSEQESLRMFVGHALGLLYADLVSNDRNNSLFSSIEKEVDEIVNKICLVGRSMSNDSRLCFETIYFTMYIYKSQQVKTVPLFKVYGRNVNSYKLFSRDRRTYDSISDYLDNNDLPHALLCFAREGNGKTYEIDPIINKYPLVFYTVNYSKGLRLSERWSPDIFFHVPFVNLLSPIKLQVICYFSLVAFRHLRISARWALDRANAGYNLVTESLKYKFIKYTERAIDFIPLFGTGENFVMSLILSFLYSIDSHIGSSVTDREFHSSLLVNGDILPSRGSSFYRLFTSCNDSPSIPRSVLKVSYYVENFLCGLLPDLNIDELIVSFMGDLDLKTIENLKIAAGKMWEKIISIAKKILKVIGSPVNSLKKMLDIVWQLGRAVFLLCIKKRPKNEIDGIMSDKNAQEILSLTGGDYSLAKFTKFKSGKDCEILDVSNVLKNEDIQTMLRLHIDHEESENNRPLIRCFMVPDNKKILMCVGPVSETIELLLKDFQEMATVNVPHDNFYVISSRKKLLKIYSHKDNASNEMVQFIYFQEK